MRGKRLLLIAAIAGFGLLFAGASFANVPAPPVNQDIGFDDTNFGAMTQLDCEACHDPGVPDRHHVLYGDPIPSGSLVPIPDADGDTVDDTNYGCLNCHGVIGTDPIEFGVERDCTVCHTGDSPHHATATAMAQHCTECHGDVVDNYDDGHTVRTYTPSLVTPQPKAYVCDTTGNSCYDDSDCPGSETCIETSPPAEGGCNFCHEAGTDTDSGVVVLTNIVNHHDTGLSGGHCTWCHQDGSPPNGELDIRVCDDCHGFESLHNIAADSDDAGTEIIVGTENPGYSHVGNGDDCFGCHGFSSASAPGTGAVIPSISGCSVSTMIAGSNTAVTLTGVAFTNISGGTEYTSDVSLTAADGSSVTLTPDIISQGEMTVTIPGSIATGNYNLQAVKGDVASNPVVISIKPEVEIADVICSEGILTVTGSGFGDAPPEGAEGYINVEVDGVPVEIISWTDAEIVVDVSNCSGVVTVNALYGSDTYDDDCQVCNADVNQDGRVDLFDFIILISEFSRDDCDTSSCQADCNGDGSVDLWDLIIIKVEFLKNNCCL